MFVYEKYNTGNKLSYEKLLNTQRRLPIHHRQLSKTDTSFLSQNLKIFSFKEHGFIPVIICMHSPTRVVTTADAIKVVPAMILNIEKHIFLPHLNKQLKKKLL